MAYTLGNKYAKNLYKRIVLLQLIIENVVTCFLEHSVDRTVREAVVHFVNLSYLKYLKQCESYVRNTAGLFCSEHVYARNVTLADLQGNYSYDQNARDIKSLPARQKGSVDHDANCWICH